MRILLVAVMVMGWRVGWTEVTCFRTPAQAALRVGELDNGGYRLEFVRDDVFGRRSWASVRSCAHPEWPALAVPAGGSWAAPRRVSTAKQGPPDVMAGKRVRVVATDSMTHLEMVGVAQNNGRIGDTLRVRILGPGDSGDQHIVEAVVRNAETLEMEP